MWTTSIYSFHIKHKDCMHILYAYSNVYAKICQTKINDLPEFNFFYDFLLFILTEVLSNNTLKISFLKVPMTQNKFVTSCNALKTNFLT